MPKRASVQLLHGQMNLDLTINHNHKTITIKIMWEVVYSQIFVDVPYWLLVLTIQLVRKWSLEKALFCIRLVTVVTDLGSMYQVRGER